MPISKTRFKTAFYLPGTNKLMPAAPTLDEGSSNNFFFYFSSIVKTEFLLNVMSIFNPCRRIVANFKIYRSLVFYMQG